MTKKIILFIYLFILLSFSWAENFYLKKLAKEKQLILSNVFYKEWIYIWNKKNQIETYDFYCQALIDNKIVLIHKDKENVKKYLKCLKYYKWSIYNILELKSKVIFFNDYNDLIKKINELKLPVVIIDYSQFFSIFKIFYNKKLIPLTNWNLLISNRIYKWNKKQFIKDKLFLINYLKKINKIFYKSYNRFLKENNFYQKMYDWYFLHKINGDWANCNEYTLFFMYNYLFTLKYFSDINYYKNKLFWQHKNFWYNYFVNLLSKKYKKNKYIFNNLIQYRIYDNKKRNYIWTDTLLLVKLIDYILNQLFKNVNKIYYYNNQLGPYFWFIYKKMFFYWHSLAFIYYDNNNYLIYQPEKWLFLKEKRLFNKRIKPDLYFNWY